jgi:choline dehydrogenase
VRNSERQEGLYEYVIVGAGSAGCVLAHRLTEDPACSVLLLESGGADTAREVHIPAAFSKLFKSAYDWSYYTEEQEQLQQRHLYEQSRSLTATLTAKPADDSTHRWNAADGQAWREAPGGRQQMLVDDLHQIRPLALFVFSSRSSNKPTGWSDAHIS